MLHHLPGLKHLSSNHPVPALTSLQKLGIYTPSEIRLIEADCQIIAQGHILDHLPCLKLFQLLELDRARAQARIGLLFLTIKVFQEAGLEATSKVVAL
ncbi:hypothetical protein L1987_68178 [Smallanthus sonchifolius]|uniref:Uncharacterized protein n=1 Tax=Smallanthus sonchifolius TaxID=185202 RepID=A0ACB9B4C6_9ASTR|nr:hypothetical protein L1987_68178 [Smallanthus sonchifolius]